MTKKLKMARRFIAAGVMIAFMFVGIASVNAQELTLTEEDMQYNAGKATIDADGDMSEWSNFPFKKAIPFQTGAGIGDGELVLFQNWGAGTWDGPEDHTSAVAFAWDVDNLYIGIVVTDDSHQNGGGAPAQAWNGDGVQAVFANAEQDTVTFLYNLAMNDGGDLLIHNERGPGGVELAVVRDDDAGTTSYEIVFPAASLEVDAFEAGMQIGIGLCGEMAGEPEFVMLLLGLGLRSLSITPPAIPEVKKVIRSVTIKQCERVAKRAQSFDSDRELLSYLRDESRKVAPEVVDRALKEY